MQAFILAGGFATRLWPLTEKRAKPLLPLAGKPIITHLVEKIPQGIPVTVSTNAALAEGFRQWMNVMVRSAPSERASNHDMELVVEGTLRDDQKLGALGSIAQWIEAEKIDDDLLILTGDNYLGFSMEKFLAAFHGNPLLAAHDIGDLERAKAFGVVIPGEGTKVKTFEEKPKAPSSTLVSTGCVILPKHTLSILKEFARVKPDNLGGIFEELLRKNIPVEYFTFTEPWMDIGSFHSYLDAHRELVGERALIDPTSIVEQTNVRGSVTIGRNCRIEQSELTDCMIFDNVTIRDCTLKNCVIDDGCALEGIDLQKQMLRAGTQLIVD